MKRSANYRLIFTLCLVVTALLGFRAIGGEAPEGKLPMPPDAVTAPEAEPVLPSAEAVEGEIPEMTPVPLVQACQEPCVAEFMICKQGCGDPPRYPCLAACKEAYEECWEIHCG